MNSPYTDHSVFAWHVRPVDALNYDVVNGNSYGRKDRRSRIGMIMPVMSIRMVPAAAAVTVSTSIPTGAFISIDYSKSHQNYWWLRSPGMDINGRGAYYVYPDGRIVLNYYVDSSYGRRYFR